MININASVASVVHAKKIIVVILAHVLVRVVWVFWYFSNCVCVYKCHGCCINKYDKSISANTIYTGSISSEDEKITENRIITFCTRFY